MVLYGNEFDKCYQSNSRKVKKIDMENIFLIITLITFAVTGIFFIKATNKMFRAPEVKKKV